MKINKTILKSALKEIEKYLRFLNEELGNALFKHNDIDIDYLIRKRSRYEVLKFKIENRLKIYDNE